jgi:plastocyanin
MVCRNLSARLWGLLGTALMRRAEFRAFVMAVILALLGSAAWAVLSTPNQVSQKGRMFQPGEISVKRGEAVEIVNDDGDLLHHAYVDSERFSFDSGDQEPGSRTDIVFSVAGTFTVLCGIHPKMKLVVRVN